MKCQRCGQKINSNDKLCTKCGEPVSEDTSEKMQQKKGNNNIEKPQKEIKKFMLILILLLLVGSGFGVMFYYKLHENRRMNE